MLELLFKWFKHYEIQKYQDAITNALGMGLLLHQACVSQCYHESFYPCHSFCQTKMSYYQTISSKDASGKWRRSQGGKPWEVTVTQNGCTEKELVNNLAFMITDSYVKVNTNNAIGKLSPNKFIITRFYR